MRGMTGGVVEAGRLLLLTRQTVAEETLHVAQIEFAVGYDWDGPGFVVYVAEGFGELRHEL